MVVPKIVQEYSVSPRLKKGQGASEEKGLFSVAKGIWKGNVTVFVL